MTKEQSADDLRRENDELREQLRQRTRADAAEKAGLDREAARWINGDTPEEAEADARKLAGELSPAPHGGSEQSAARANAKQEEADRRELAMALSGNGQPTPESEGRE